MDMPPMPPERVIEQKLVECGLERGGLSISYSALLQSIEVVISPSANAAAGQFKCIRAATSGEIVTFEDAEFAKAYAHFEYETLRPEILRSARDTLASYRLLEGFPERGRFGDDAEFARALEVHCGFAAEAIIEHGEFGLRVTPDKLPQGRLSKTWFRKFSCLMASITYVSARDGDFKVGLIGNEAFGVSQD